MEVILIKNELKQLYERRKERFEAEMDRVMRHSKAIEKYRLITFILGVIAFLGYTFYYQSYLLILGTAAMLFVFLLLVVKHSKLKRIIEYYQNLIQINERAILRLIGEWNTFNESGAEFINSDHPYSSDLDIFGRGSLFQYINAASTFLGKKSLADKLMGRNLFEEIKPRNDSIRELATAIEWRQSYQARGMEAKSKDENITSLLKWAEDKSSYDYKYLNYIFILPIITMLSLILYFFQLLHLNLPLFLIAVQVIIASLSYKYVSSGFEGVNKSVRELSCYSYLLKSIENENFKAPFLISLQKKITDKEQSASKHIKELAKIADNINMRSGHPLIYFPLNVMTFWDIYTYKRLKDWKRKLGSSMGKWFKVMGEFEALSSFAGLAHDNPQWVFPEVNNGPPFLEATSLGHPLINADERVCNDVSMPEPGSVMLITGSNMSGKSTYLRTIGVNLVLAYAGAPVCAEKMNCPFLNIYTKMQVHDDLEQKTSTFYAELKRIKMIIDATEEGKPVIFLLDEIFRGTNSKDRIYGTKVVIRNLSRASTIGLLTTHDLELASLEKELPGLVKNFHFTDKIYNNEIHFDYIIRRGVSQSTNAVALMKMIGIE